MKTYARILNNMAIDVTTSDPSENFHPDVASQFIEVPEGTVNGAIYTDGTWSNPVSNIPSGEAQTRIKVSPVEFKLLFSAEERVAIKLSDDPLVQDFFELVENQRIVNAADASRGLIDLSLQSTKEALAYLEMRTLIKVGRAATILNGLPL